MASYLLNNVPAKSKFVNEAEAEYIADKSVVVGEKIASSKREYKLAWLNKIILTGGLLSLGYSMYMAYPMGRANKETYPIAWSVVNMGGQIGGASAPLIVGMILDKYN